jgi:tRNA(Ile)-lysidine synthase
LHLVHFDTRQYATLHKVSIELAARQLRYGYFEQLRSDVGAAAICVAHHRDDQVETVLMNMIRGTGLHGLTGMRPKNGRIVRPLLCVSRKEIVAWLEARGQQFVTDSSNLKDDVTRNKIRLHVIPLLEAINPLASNNISVMASRLVEVEKTVESMMKRQPVLSISELKKQPSPQLFLYYQLKDYGFTATQIEQIAGNLDAESGRAFYSPTHQLVFHRGNLIVEPKGQPMKPLIIPEAGTYVLSENRRFRVSRIDKTADFCLPRSCDVAFLDASKLTFPLTVRTPETGDRFSPFGLHGSKLLSDFMTDCKMSLFEKRRQLVVADAAGQILWVVGRRISEMAKITDDTRGIVRLEYLS